VTGAFVSESAVADVEIEFGVNRWVVVSIGSEQAQEQIGSRSELQAYLQERGLLESEATAIARNAWRRRPRDAAKSVPELNDSLLGPTSRTFVLV
jgi:hypothetical protein